MYSMYICSALELLTFYLNQKRRKPYLHTFYTETLSFFLFKQRWIYQNKINIGVKTQLRKTQELKA